MLEFNIEEAINTLYELQIRGIVPIIAHPERYKQFIKNPSQINLLIKEGMLFQVNAGSINGDFGRDVKKTAIKYLNNNIYNNKNNSQMYSQENINNKDLQRSMQEALKKEQENLRIQKAYAKRQAEMEQEYNNAYYKYLKSLGYKVKFKWTWKQYVMLFIIVIGLILWVIPPTHDWMLNLYNDNIFIKTIVNIFIGIFNGIGKMISGIFNNS